MIVLEEHEAQRGEYGEDLAEATSAAADPNGGHIRYVAHSVVNHARAAVERAQYERREEPTEAGFGRNWYVERRVYPRQD
jgi:hypothetical protein